MNTTRMHRAKLSVERLEDRNTPSVAVSGGTLILTGSDLDDSFTVLASVNDENGFYFTIIEQTGDAAPVTTIVPHADYIERIYFSGGDGNDTLTGTPTGVPLLAYGGPGDDYLEAVGDGVVEMYGEDGNDTLIGRSDDHRWVADGLCVYTTNKLYGGNGNDELFGSYGPDQLYGGAGRDKLFGQDGDDQLFGEAGRDELRGEAGNDTMNGGEDDGQDHLFGGTGADVFHADWLYLVPVNDDNPQDFNADDGDTIEPAWESPDLVRLAPLHFDFFGVTLDDVLRTPNSVFDLIVDGSPGSMTSPGGKGGGG